MDVFSAKVKMVDVVSDLNLPMSSLDKLSKGMKKMFDDSKTGKSFQCARTSKGTAISKEISALLLSMSALFLLENPLHYDINLWFVPEILVFVREMSLNFDFWGRHACLPQADRPSMNGNFRCS